MHWQLILWTDWLRIQNTLQQSPFHPNLTFTHLHHKPVVWHLWCRWVILAFLTNCLTVMQMVNVIQVWMWFGFLTKLFTEFTVHTCNMFTQTQIANGLFKWQFPFYSMYNYTAKIIFTLIKLIFTFNNFLPRILNTLQQSPFHQNLIFIYLHHKQVVKNAEIMLLICITNARLLAGEVNG